MGKVHTASWPIRAETKAAAKRIFLELLNLSLTYPAVQFVEVVPSRFKEVEA